MGFARACLPVHKHTSIIALDGVLHQSASHPVKQLLLGRIVRKNFVEGELVLFEAELVAYLVHYRLLVGWFYSHQHLD